MFDVLPTSISSPLSTSLSSAVVFINDFTLLAAANPVDHVTDKPLVGDFLISNVTIMLIVSAIVTCAIIMPAAKRIAAKQQNAESAADLAPSGPWANLVEAICLGLRDEIFKPLLKEQTDKFMPILWTFFWFILTCNMLGLIPILDLTYELGKFIGLGKGEGASWYGIGGTATQSIWVTGALALIAFLYYNYHGLKTDPVGFFAHLTGGAPWYMWPIIIPVEVMGIFIKPFALALRLFANMTGGHVLLAALFGFVPALGGALGAVGIGAGIIPLAGAVAINVLEILVAFLQAFIFTFLTGLFLSQLVVHEHHDEHHDHVADLPGELDERGDNPAGGPIPGASV